MPAVFYLLVGLLASSCQTGKAIFQGQRDYQSYGMRLDSLNLFDAARNRPVPVTLYRPQTDHRRSRIPLVIFSHGYAANEPGASRNYSYLTEYLAVRGYWVASVQHELPTDSLMPTTGIPQVVRRPFWERGVQNILFVLGEMQKNYPHLDYGRLILIGHSNGGDMTMLFAQQYPGRVAKAISLDNRRVALPRTRHPNIYSLRADDDPADPGVLPTPAEQQRYGMTLVFLPGIKHNQLSNAATAPQRQIINQYIGQLLQD